MHAGCVSTWNGAHLIALLKGGPASTIALLEECGVGGHAEDDCTRIRRILSACNDTMNFVCMQFCSQQRGRARVGNGNGPCMYDQLCIFVRVNVVM